jgi:hypothetical protein
MFVCCECCVLSGRGLGDGLITRPEEFYRLWHIVLCDQETSNEEAKARYGSVENTTKRFVTPRKQTNNHRVYLGGSDSRVIGPHLSPYRPDDKGARVLCLSHNSHFVVCS